LVHFKAGEGDRRNAKMGTHDDAHFDDCPCETYICESGECQHRDPEYGVCLKATHREPVRIAGGKCLCYNPKKKEEDQK